MKKEKIDKWMFGVIIIESILLILMFVWINNEITYRDSYVLSTEYVINEQNITIQKQNDSIYYLNCELEHYKKLSEQPKLKKK
jgi:hypothetical protein